MDLWVRNIKEFCTGHGRNMIIKPTSPFNPVQLYKLKADNDQYLPPEAGRYPAHMQWTKLINVNVTKYLKMCLYLCMHIYRYGDIYIYIYMHQQKISIKQVPRTSVHRWARSTRSNRSLWRAYPAWITTIGKVQKDTKDKKMESKFRIRKPHDNNLIGSEPKTAPLQFRAAIALSACKRREFHKYSGKASLPIPKDIKVFHKLRTCCLN